MNAAPFIPLDLWLLFAGTGVVLSIFACGNGLAKESGWRYVAGFVVLGISLLFFLLILDVMDDGMGYLRRIEYFDEISVHYVIHKHD